MTMRKVLHPRDERQTVCVKKQNKIKQKTKNKKTK